MAKGKRNFNPDADLDEDVENYEPSDSDDDYDDNEKLLLEKVRKGKALHEEDYDDDEDSDHEEEVLGIYSSDEEKEDGAEKNDSDIEGMEDDKLPDSKAWGKRRKDYYYTDYVDQDFGGFAREEEEEVAMMEENEARTLQSRLAAQLDDVDLSLGLLSKEKKKDDVDDDIGLEDDDIVKTDLSKLTKREKLTLFQKESPEFFGLVNDYKERLTYAKDKLFPVMKLIKNGHIPSNLPCSKFVELKIHLTLNYCTNVAFYIVLKKKRIPIKDHPVTERLLKYRTLLQQLDGLQNDQYIEQFDEIIEQFKNENLETSDAMEIKNKSSKKKKKLNLLSMKENDIKITKPQKRKLSMSEGNTDAVVKEEIAEDASENESDLFDDGEDNSDVEETPAKKLKNSVDSKISKQEDADGKRAITYEMAKNKGLTPYRKREQRNPRVKYKNKYRKALIRRKGQVREVKKEVTKYGGEIFGIKASVVKSRKLK